MSGVAVPNGELVRGLPHGYTFRATAAVDDTKTKWYGPSPQITKTAPTSFNAATNIYTAALTPDDLGTWTVEFYDSSSNLLNTATFVCVEAMRTQHELGLQNKYHTLVPVWNDTLLNDSTNATGTSALSNSGNNVRCFAGFGKQVAATDTLVFGISSYFVNGVGTNWPALTSIRFFTLDPVTNLVRGVSGNLKAKFAALVTGGYQTVMFDLPVPMRAGDMYGVEVDATGQTGVGHFTRGAAATATASVNKIYVKDSALNLSGTNSFAQFSTVTDILLIKPLIHPPAIVTCGHSFWASSPDSAPVITNAATAYSRAQDFAAMVMDSLGVPVLNGAIGGTNLSQWVGSSGYFETVIKPLRPSAITYDTVYNDIGLGLSDSAYLAYLDRLVTHCDQAGIELIMLEAPGSYNAAVIGGSAWLAATTYSVADTATYGGASYVCQAGIAGNAGNTNPATDTTHWRLRSAWIERYNAMIAQWCQHMSVGYVPLTFRCGMYSGGTEHHSLRRIQKHGLLGLADYDERTTDLGVHLTQAGRLAAARAVANHFRCRRDREPRTLMPRSSLADVSPAYPIVGAGF